MALAIGAVGYGASFAVVAAFPLMAALLVPVAGERAAAASQPGTSACPLTPATTAEPR